MKSLIQLLVLALAIPLALVASGAGTAKPAPGASDAMSYTITIKDFEFTPRDLVIPAGSKVTWTNKDEEPHKVAETNNAFTSQPLDTDGGFTYEFKTPGKYEYFCTVHPRMTGKIIVEDK
jgi:plastocyanin